MFKEFLLPEDKKRLKELYVGYHSPWNEAHEQEIFKREIDEIWSHYKKIK
jgi:hypothetical protein